MGGGVFELSVLVGNLGTGRSVEISSDWDMEKRSTGEFESPIAIITALEFLE